MKRFLFFLFMLINLSAFAQIENQKLITVKDTVLFNDARVNFMVKTILPSIHKFMIEENAPISNTQWSFTLKCPE